VLIAAVLLVALMLGIEAGYRIGQLFQPRFSDSAQTHAYAIRASMFTIIGLLMALTFSQSLDRFDARSEAVVDEANAIGTAYLRAKLAPLSVRELAQNDLRDYLDLRVQAAAISLDHPEEAESLLVRTQQKQADLWQYAQQAATEDSSPVVALFVESINELIDSFARRQAEITRHVPEPVILLLMITPVLTGVVVGFAYGAGGHRPSVTSYVLALIIVLLLLVIIDLDRPRRGLIEVPQDSLIDLQTTIQAETTAPNQ
jgi:hypothetical protein